MHRLKGWLQGAAVFTAITLALFLLVNLVAYLLLASYRDEQLARRSEQWFVPPLSPEGQQVLRRVFSSRDEQLFLELISGDPSIRPHPVLAFTEGLSTARYRIGLESIRYEPGWTDEQVAGWLGREGEFVYLLGGSTAFGHGVPDDQTLTAHLNRRAGEVRYLNLAVQAYDSIREVDRLLYLLRKGHRPAEVIFLDGLNDVTTFAWSNYPAHDKPRTQGLLLNRGQVGLIYGFPRRRNMLSAFLFSLPVVQLAARWQTPLPGRLEYRPRDAAAEPMSWQELMLYYEQWDRVQGGRKEALAGELAEYHRENLEFLRRVGEAFGFRVRVVYQPIGLLYRDNPFLREVFFESAPYQVYRAADEALRERIESGALGMIDCSRSLEGVELAWVDSTHYSPQGNETLAECLEGPGKIR